MKKYFIRLTIIAAMLIISFNAGYCAEIDSGFTMVGTWKAEYKSQNITITLNEKHKGTLLIEGAEPVEILKWEEELGKKGKVAIGLYFFSRDKKRFVKRTLKMYNAGRGFKLKAIYQSKNLLKVYNALSIQDGKIEVDDGRMELKR